jgi:hypothetical protein
VLIGGVPRCLVAEFDTRAVEEAGGQRWRRTRQQQNADSAVHTQALNALREIQLEQARAIERAFA